MLLSLVQMSLNQAIWVAVMCETWKILAFINCVVIPGTLSRFLPRMILVIMLSHFQCLTSHSHQVTNR